MITKKGRKKILWGISSALFLALALASFSYAEVSWSLEVGREEAREAGALALALTILSIFYLFLSYIFWRIIVDQAFCNKWPRERRASWLSLGLFLSILPLALSAPILAQPILAAPLAFLLGFLPFAFLLIQERKSQESKPL